MSDINWKPGEHGWYWSRSAGHTQRVHVTVRSVSDDRKFLRVELPSGGLITVRTITYDRLRPICELPPLNELLKQLK